MVEGAPLLREYTSKAYRGFESHPLRHDPCFHCIIWLFSPLAITWSALFCCGYVVQIAKTPQLVILAGLVDAVVAVGSLVANFASSRFFGFFALPAVHGVEGGNNPRLCFV